MSQELLYTSAPKGLKPGSRGFCMVLCSEGMPAPLATALEGLSGYKPLFPPGHPQEAQNPVVRMHVVLPALGRKLHVLSRIASFGLDYSGRPNKLAHHVVADTKDQAAAGPGWLMNQKGVLRSDWQGEPRLTVTDRSLPSGQLEGGVCHEWAAATGDAGWAGVLAESLLADPNRQAYLMYEPGFDPYPLIAEAIALLPPERRWDATFSTCYNNLPPGVTCNWRCIQSDSPLVHQSKRQVQALRIDLTESMGKATGGALVEFARSGMRPVTKPPTIHMPEIATGPQTRQSQSAYQLQVDKSAKAVASASRHGARCQKRDNDRKPSILTASMAAAFAIIAVVTVSVFVFNRSPVNKSSELASSTEPLIAKTADTLAVPPPIVDPPLTEVRSSPPSVVPLQPTEESQELLKDSLNDGEPSPSAPTTTQSDTVPKNNGTTIETSSDKQWIGLATNVGTDPMRITAIEEDAVVNLFVPDRHPPDKSWIYSSNKPNGGLQISLPGLLERFPLASIDVADTASGTLDVTLRFEPSTSQYAYNLQYCAIAVTRKSPPTDWYGVFLKSEADGGLNQADYLRPQAVRFSLGKKQELTWALPLAMPEKGERPLLFVKDFALQVDGRVCRFPAEASNHAETLRRPIPKDGALLEIHSEELGEVLNLDYIFNSSKADIKNHCPFVTVSIVDDDMHASVLLRIVLRSANDMGDSFCKSVNLAFKSCLESRKTITEKNVTIEPLLPQGGNSGPSLLLSAEGRSQIGIWIDAAKAKMSKMDPNVAKAETVAPAIVEFENRIEELETLIKRGKQCEDAMAMMINPEVVAATVCYTVSNLNARDETYEVNVIDFGEQLSSGAGVREMPSVGDTP